MSFYYPVTEEEIDIILEGGLNPIDRKNVHLSGSIEKAIEAGKVRTEDPLAFTDRWEKSKRRWCKDLSSWKGCVHHRPD